MRFRVERKRHQKQTPMDIGMAMAAIMGLPGVLAWFRVS
jgi:hypothetical protein